MPSGFLERVIEYRAYARAYLHVEVDPKASGEIEAEVKQIELAIVGEEVHGG